MASVEVNQMLAAATAACEDKKAEDIRILALDPAESGLADYFLICTGTNDRQTVAITDEIELRLKREFSTYPNSVEGRRQGEWILMDYVDFIVHVFLPERRAYYGLERLRPSATTLGIDELNAEIKNAITAKRPRKVVARLAAEGHVEDNENSAALKSRKAVRKAATPPADRAPRSAAKSTGAPRKTAAPKPARKTPAKSSPSTPLVAAKKSSATRRTKPEDRNA